MCVCVRVVHRRGPLFVQHPFQKKNKNHIFIGYPSSLSGNSGCFRVLPCWTCQAKQGIQMSKGKTLTLYAISIPLLASFVQELSLSLYIIYIYRV